jgi:ferredoxin
MKAIINEGCIGCGACANTCPKVFRMNDEGLAEVYNEVNEDNINDVNAAVEVCPMQIISITE